MIKIAKEFGSHRLGYEEKADDIETDMDMEAEWAQVGCRFYPSLTTNEVVRY